ncbi:uncharacterized protein BDZ83DRAFT_603913 [Colletotrichum acutatum]|uniref:Secreted protein n=1 Tax=Glomerella acutata TaxID=27357 RepID=A0AAD8XM91_GLOAC|nr:uncharacterized protein BDZ83DRAFT_603913 [Colletotrichum acutatum]KAK1729903.1 hypothetical protein BDZ83DRAFT_603913 [Colletotrichum acutatum]
MEHRVLRVALFLLRVDLGCSLGRGDNSNDLRLVRIGLGKQLGQEERRYYDLVPRECTYPQATAKYQLCQFSMRRAWAGPAPDCSGRGRVDVFIFFGGSMFR